MNLDRASLRRSGIGATVGAAVFGSVSLYRSLLAEGGLLDYLGPMGMMTVIGATVGGLVGPLIGEAWKRRRERRMAKLDEGTGDVGGVAGPNRSDGSDGSDASEGGNGSVPSHAGGGRQPFWFTLLVGAGVGFGIGTAWGRIWVGVMLGLVLALLARRVFA